MSTHLSVRQLKALPNEAGRAFSAVLLLRRLTAKTASSGNPFLSVELGDKTGSFTCTVFGDSPVFELLKGSSEGVILQVEGKTDYFQGRFSPRLHKAEFLGEKALSDPSLLSNLVETAPEDPAALLKDLQDAVAGIVHPELKATVLSALEEIGTAFQTAPAAIAMHHAYRHGLLEHTVHMVRVARALLPLYTEVDPDLAMAGTILHDAGKAIEYEGDLASRKSRRGLLQGHVVLGYQLVRKAALKSKLDPERLERLEHIILSHQGQLEWGAAVMAATPEAVFVSMIDNLDAMGMVQQALRQSDGSQEFSERIAGLESALLLKIVGRTQT